MVRGELGRVGTSLARTVDPTSTLPGVELASGRAGSPAAKPARHVLRYALGRLCWAVPTILGILVVGFVVTRILPGDPVQALMGEFPAPPGYADELRRQFGLDQPFYVQFWLYLVALARGDLGYSFAHQAPVLSIVLERAVYTLFLMVPALTLASILGVLLGAVAAPRAGSKWDAFITMVSICGQSVPVFWLAMMLILVFAVSLGILPASGMRSVSAAPSAVAALIDYLRHLVLPGITLTLAYMAVVARVSRSAMIESLHQDYVLTAQAKGLTRREALWRHALPNSLAPIATVIGFNFGYVLTGAVLTETVFGWPGVGSLFISSIANRDYPVIEGIFLFSTITVVVVNLLIDLLYFAIDPRVRADNARP